MRASMDHARAQLHQAQMEPLAANRLRAAVEISGSPIDYIEKSVPADSGLGPFRWQQPQQPYDVVISGNDDEWRIDGYGKSLEQPLISEQVRHQP